MTDPALAGGDAPARRLAGAVRESWWVVAGVTALVGFVTFLALFRVTPLFEAVGSVRIDREGTPFRGLDALETLEVLTGTTGPGIQTEMAVLRSRTLALLVDEELSIRARVERPIGTPRSLLFRELQVDPTIPETQIELEWVGEAYRVEAERREPPEVWRPFRLIPWVEAGTAEVRPGEAFDVAGVRGVLTDEAPDLAPRIRVAIRSDEEFYDEYLRFLSVLRPAREAELVEMRFRSPDPSIARDVVNRLSARYIADRQSLRAREARSTASFLADQVVRVRDELGMAENDLRRFREREQVIAPLAEAQAQVTRLTEMRGQRDVTDAERRALEGLLAQIVQEDAASPGGASPWRRLIAFPTLLRNAATAEFLRLLGELENDRAVLLETRAPEDPLAVQLSGRIRDLEGQLRSMTETYLAGLGRQVASLDVTLEASGAELDRIPAADLEFARHTRRVELLSEVLTVLEVRQREAEIQAVVEDMSVQVVDAAPLPLEPVTPRPWLSLALSLLVGTALGTVGALIRQGA